LNAGWVETLCETHRGHEQQLRVSLPPSFLPSPIRASADAVAFELRRQFAHPPKSIWAAVSDGRHRRTRRLPRPQTAPRVELSLPRTAADLFVSRVARCDAATTASEVITAVRTSLPKKNARRIRPMTKRAIKAAVVSGDASTKGPASRIAAAMLARRDRARLSPSPCTTCRCSARKI